MMKYSSSSIKDGLAENAVTRYSKEKEKKVLQYLDLRVLKKERPESVLNPSKLL
ncbi:MAG: hypothetical protein ACFFDK_05435 [Promethearchaeota archaeon]